MFIHVYLVILSFLLISIHIDAKPGRRKGLLTQSSEFENWTGKWFPFNPSIAAKMESPTKPFIDVNAKPGRRKGMLNQKSDFGNWTGKWFPFNPSIAAKMESSRKTFNDVNLNRICDDEKLSVAVDFDPSDKRQSYFYICLTKNRTIFEPNFGIEAVQLEHIVPPTYVPPVKCLNESISYKELPTFGAIRPLAPKFGTYEYLPPQRWLRAVAEGAVVMLYHPCAYTSQVISLQNILKSCLYRHIITPTQNLDAERPLALIAWGKILKMSVVNQRAVVDFIKSNAKAGPLVPLRTELEVLGTSYQVGLLSEAKLITDIDDTEICGYKEM